MKSVKDTRGYVREASIDSSQVNFFAFLRLLNALESDKPKIGAAKSLREEIVEFKQPAYLEFAPSTVSDVKELPNKKNGGAVASLETYFLGLSGPNGPLPHSITDYILSRKNGLTHPDRVVEGRRDTSLNRRDSSLFDFLNIFNHRFISYFYRVWSTSRKAPDYDRPDESKFPDFIASLSGTAGIKTPFEDSSHNYFSGHFANKTRHPEGLVKIIGDLLNCTVELEENVGDWISLPGNEIKTLGQLSDRGASSLGEGIALGEKIWDRQLRFDLHIGPISFNLFEKFVPKANGEDSELVKQLKHITALYTDRVFFCYAHIGLKKAEVPDPILGSNQSHFRLGVDSWLRNKEHRNNPKGLLISLT